MASSSSSQPPPSTSLSSSAPASSSSPSSSSGSVTTSSTLYLFTFLATLFVLLAISSTIIIRSYILRRRFRRQVAEAIAAGVYVDIPPPGIMTSRPGRHFRVFGEKPRVHERWIIPATKGQEKWEDIMPISAQIIRPAQQQKPFASASSFFNNADMTPTPTLFPRSMRNPFTRSAHSLPPSNSSTTAPTSALLKSEDRLAVSVLISMPSSHSHAHVNREVDIVGSPDKGKAKVSDDDLDGVWEGEIPPVLIGVAELPYAGPNLGQGSGKERDQIQS